MLFNGTYTLVNEEGVHKTFLVKTQKKDARFAAGERMVSLLTGTDNESSYKGFAFVKDDDRILVWRKKRGNGKMSAFDYFAYLLPKAAQSLIGEEGEELEGEFEVNGRKYKVLLSKKCMYCNRKLTTPESIRRGVGPECAKMNGLV